MLQFKEYNLLKGKSSLCLAAAAVTATARSASQPFVLAQPGAGAPNFCFITIDSNYVIQSYLLVDIFKIYNTLRMKEKKEKGRKDGNKIFTKSK